MNLQRLKHLESRLKHLENHELARQMAAYVKTDRPLYGIKTPERRALLKAALSQYPITDFADYQDTILHCWQRDEREWHYIAMDIAAQTKKFRTPEAWPLFSRLVYEAYWWDNLDLIATKLVGELWLNYPDEFRDEIISWLEHDSMWVRRAALLVHLKHKDKTNKTLLAKSILVLADEKEFFIRKAIGWVLREFAKTDPNWVRDFVEKYDDRLSKLSKTEALKHLKR